MSARCRFSPAPRPSLKSEHTPKPPTYGYCSCNSQCSRDSCTCSDQSRNFTIYSEGSTPPYPPQPPSPHVHFLGLYQTYFVDYDYDRSSTVVMPNECALPARGCPGKTYFPTQVANAARTGRRLGRCATPGASRANSRNRNNNMSPPPSPSLYAKHIFYPDEYPFPSPIPSPRAMAAPPLVPDTGFTPQVSDDSDQGLCTPPEAASQIPTPLSLSRRATSGYPSSHMGSQLFIDAPGHPPIPGLMSPTTTRTTRDMFAITNALNGLDMSNGGSGGGVGVVPGRRSSHSHSTTEGMTPKKLKVKKSKSSVPSSPGEANGAVSAAKRGRIVSPPVAGTAWRSDTGALGGF